MSQFICVRYSRKIFFKFKIFIKSTSTTSKGVWYFNRQGLTREFVFLAIIIKKLSKKTKFISMMLIFFFVYSFHFNDKFECDLF